jgi:hypothetical protein
MKLIERIQRMSARTVPPARPVFSLLVAADSPRPWLSHSGRCFFVNLPFQELKPQRNFVRMFWCDLFVAEHAERYQTRTDQSKPKRTGYVAYYRVSTDKQGENGLGLEAQREAVNQIARNAPVLAEFTEVETAKKSSASNRPPTARRH